MIFKESAQGAHHQRMAGTWHAQHPLRPVGHPLHTIVPQHMAAGSRWARGAGAAARPVRGATSAGHAQAVRIAHGQRPGPVGPRTLSAIGHLWSALLLPLDQSPVLYQLSYPKPIRSGDRTRDPWNWRSDQLSYLDVTGQVLDSNQLFQS